MRKILLKLNMVLPLTNDLIRMHHRNYTKLKMNVRMCILENFTYDSPDQFEDRDQIKYCAMFFIRHTTTNGRIDIDGQYGAVKPVLDVLSSYHKRINSLGIGLIEDDNQDRLVKLECVTVKSPESFTEVIIHELSEEEAAGIIHERASTAIMLTNQFKQNQGD